MDMSEKFEQAFVTVIQEILAEYNIKAKEFAEKVFRDQVKPENKWLRIRKGLNDGKAQRVTLEEAYRMAKALQHDLPTLLWRVQKQLESQGKSGQPVKPAKKKMRA